MVAISCWPRHLRTRSSPEDSDAYRNVRLPSRGKGETMVAVRDFSGLDISAWALASAAARMPTLGLDCCMIGLFSQQFEADRSRFRAFCFYAVPSCFPCILRHEGF